MKTFLGFTVGLLLGALGFATLAVVTPEGADLVRDVSYQVNGLK